MSTTSGDPTLKSIAIVIAADAAGQIQALGTEPIHLSPAKHHKVRWCIYNNLDTAVTSITIGSFTGSTTPLCANNPNLTAGPIPSGGEAAVCTETCEAASSPSGTTFQYSVTIKISGKPDIVKNGPRIIIQ
ncbi:MAG TPA: hypothetical protein VIG62_09280 [Blastocatellia bacterium]|jgi:hypothetical protein